jgi:hypothetical protein
VDVHQYQVERIIMAEAYLLHGLQAIFNAADTAAQNLEHDTDHLLVDRVVFREQGSDSLRGLAV